MRIELDLIPPSTNMVYRRSQNGRMFMTEEGHAFKDMLGMLAKLKWKSPPSNKPITIRMVLEFPDKRKRDINNFDKLVFDSMENIVYQNDSQVVDWHVTKSIGHAKPRTIVVVQELN